MIPSQAPSSSIGPAIAPLIAPSPHAMFMTDIPDLHALFIAVDEVLTHHRPLWQVRAFHDRDLPWRNSHPDLCTALKALDEAAIDGLEEHPGELLAWLTPWIDEAANEAIAFVDRLPALPQRSLTTPARLETGIGGRKWLQIQALAAILPEERRPLLEWCSGKGHLGRLLALVDDRPVVSLEHDETLCRAGAHLAAVTNASQQFVVADALSAASKVHLPMGGQVLALHACGDLHTRLMHFWVTSDCRRLTVAPCCFHLTADTVYRPLSTTAAGSALQLERLNLQWAVRRVVTGGTGAQRRRRQELIWRLAFDEWQRSVRDVDTYLPLPSFPKSLLSGSFQQFCEWAAVTKDLALDPDFTESDWLHRGMQRARLARLTELAGRPFQRLLELWLVLDRALFLQQHGATVQIGAFCDYQLTPRNLVIDAEKV